MKLTADKTIGLLLAGYKIYREIRKQEKVVSHPKAKHEAVKEALMPYLNKKYAFSGDDVDKIINGIIWFIKKCL
jgi:enterochelin esterase-like enzyme